MTVHFARGWDDRRRKLVGPLNERRALKTLTRGADLFVVEVPKPGAVADYVLAVRDGGRVVTTQRYDETGSLDLVVQHEAIGEVLFRSGLVTYTYPEDDDYRPTAEAESVLQRRYQPDGNVDEQVSRSGEDEDETHRYLRVEVETHWLPPLRWGQWARFGLLEADDLADPVLRYR